MKVRLQILVRFLKGDNSPLSSLATEGRHVVRIYSTEAATDPFKIMSNSISNRNVIKIRWWQLGMPDNKNSISQRNSAGSQCLKCIEDHKNNCILSIIVAFGFWRPLLDAATGVEEFRVRDRLCSPAVLEWCFSKAKNTGVGLFGLLRMCRGRAAKSCPNIKTIRCN